MIFREVIPNQSKCLVQRPQYKSPTKRANIFESVSFSKMWSETSGWGSNVRGLLSSGANDLNTIPTHQACAHNMSNMKCSFRFVCKIYQGKRAGYALILRLMGWIMISIFSTGWWKNVTISQKNNYQNCCSGATPIQIWRRGMTYVGEGMWSSTQATRITSTPCQYNTSGSAQV